MKFFASLFGAISIIFVNATGVMAADDASVKSPLAILYACSDITDDTLRLDCLDANLAKIRQAEESKAIVAVDAKTITAMKKEGFGFKLPSLGKISFPKIGKGEKKEVLEAKVTSLSGGRGTYTLILDNGQVWQATGGSGSIPKGDLTVRIKPASMGSYLADISNGVRRARSVRMKRVQ